MSPSPLLVLVVSPLYAWGDCLKFLQVAVDGRCGRIERFPVLRLVLVRMSLELLENKIGVSVEQEVCLRVISFCFVDLRLRSVSVGTGRKLGNKSTSFCIVLAVRSQFDSGICALYV